MKGKLAAFIVLLTLLGGVTSAHAAPSGGLAYAPPEAPPPVSITALLLRLFGMTVFVLLLCAGLLWLVRYTQRPRIFGAGAPEKLRLLETARLNGRCTVHLIEAGHCRILAAVDPTGLKSCQVVSESFAGVLAGVTPPAESGPSIETLLSALANYAQPATYGRPPLST